MEAVQKRREVARGERPGIWVVDGVRYVSATIAGVGALLPLNRPFLLEERGDAPPAIRTRFDPRCFASP